MHFRISAPTWNDEFNLSDGPYSVSDIQDYFEYIVKKHEAVADNSPAQIYVTKIKNSILFEIKTGYKLELLSKETIIRKLKKDIYKNKDGENVPKLESV